jgi:hypothetical protein
MPNGPEESLSPCRPIKQNESVRFRRDFQQSSMQAPLYSFVYSNALDVAELQAELSVAQRAAVELPPTAAGHFVHLFGSIAPLLRLGQTS